MICRADNGTVERAGWDVILLYVLIAPPSALCAFIGILLLTVGGAFPPLVIEPLFAPFESNPPLALLFWIIGGYLAAHAMALIAGTIMAILHHRIRHVAKLAAVSAVVCIYVPSFLITAVGAMPPHPLTSPVQYVITGCGAIAGIVCALSIHQLRRNGHLA